MWTGSTKPANLTDTYSAPATSLLYFFRWFPGHNSALLANAHRPDLCLPATGWRQTHDFHVRDYLAAPGLMIPFRHFEFSNETAGRVRYAHAFYCVWEDRVPKSGKPSDAANMSTTPSAWSRSERIQAVLDGRRHLGQQVMEYLLVRADDLSAEQAEEIFASLVPSLVTPAARRL
jgi:hypothetical protein